MNEVAELTQAQRLLAAMAEEGADVDNLFVVFSRKDEPHTIMVGLTNHSPMMWVLGAAEYARWHLYNLMTDQRNAKTYDMIQAVEEAVQLQDLGIKPS